MSFFSEKNVRTFGALATSAIGTILLFGVLAVAVYELEHGDRAYGSSFLITALLLGVALVSACFRIVSDSRRPLTLWVITGALSAVAGWRWNEWKQMFPGHDFPWLVDGFAVLVTSILATLRVRPPFRGE